MQEKKLYKHFYVTEQLIQSIKDIADAEDLKNVQILKRAISCYQQHEKEIPEKVKITQRSHPDYIKRDVQFSVHIEKNQYEYVLHIAELEKCKYSVVLYYILSEYVSMYKKNMDR